MQPDTPRGRPVDRDRCRASVDQSFDAAAVEFEARQEMAALICREAYLPAEQDFRLRCGEFQRLDSIGYRRPRLHGFGR